MSYPITEAHLETLRDDMRDLRQRGDALKEQVQELRCDHDAHIKEIVAKRERREARGSVYLGILLGVTVVLNVIAIMLARG